MRLAAVAIGTCALAVLLSPAAGLGDRGQALDAAAPPEATLESVISPKSLPSRHRSPARLRFGWDVEASEARQPLALRELVVGLDRNIAFHLHRYPSCEAPLRSDSRLPGIPKKCRRAVVARGAVGVQIDLLEMLIRKRSKLTVIKGRERGGTTTLYGYFEIRVPVPAAIVATIKVRHARRGRFGTEAAVTIPKIASGSGSITSFSFHIGKGIGYRHTRRSLVNARCPDEHLEAKARAVFADETETTSESTQACRSRQ